MKLSKKSVGLIVLCASCFATAPSTQAATTLNNVKNTFIGPVGMPADMQKIKDQLRNSPSRFSKLWAEKVPGDQQIVIISALKDAGISVQKLTEALRVDDMATLKDIVGELNEAKTSFKGKVQEKNIIKAQQYLAAFFQNN